MNLTTKRINLRPALLSSAALVSMLGRMIMTASSANALEVTTRANLDRGINRISVDLRDFIKKDVKGRVRPSCTGDLDSGKLVIRCDVSNYVEGGGVFPFSVPESNIKSRLELPEANTN